MKFGKGQSPRRLEDHRLVTGQGKYTDDVQLENTAYLATVRSPYAHGKILSIDTDDAKEMDRVLAIYTFEDMKEYGPIPCFAQLENVDGTPSKDTPRPALAKDKVLFVGDPVAFVVAETRQAARDAAEAVMLDVEELPPVANLRAAKNGEGSQLWEHVPGNEVFDWQAGNKDVTDEAFANAHHITSIEVVNNRVAPSAMENRASVGHQDPETGKLTLYIGSQGVNALQGMIAGAILQMDPADFRIVTRDVGGGFGMKFFVYPEYVGVLHAARALGRPVKWTGDRSESFMTDAHGRDLITNAEMALDETGKILAMRTETWANMGAYLSAFGPGVQTVAGGLMIGGMYAIPGLYNRVHGMVTNTAPVDAYRGAGRPEATYMTERLIDRAARELGLDVDEIRYKNFARPDQMPYTTPLGQVYDTGEFAAVLDLGKKTADWDGYEARKAASEAKGMLRGRGLGFYIEITSFGNDDEWCDLEFNEEGGVDLIIGTQSTGQGHETAYAQILSSELDLPIEDIKVIQGDTERVKNGAGTGGSRSIHIGGAAVIEAAKLVRSKAKPLVAAALEADESDITFEDGIFRAGTSNRTMTIEDATKQFASQLNVNAKYTCEHPTYPNGAHICEVEIDPDTGVVSVDRYAAVDDFGKLLNPMLVQGQVHGGVAQGLGQALLEHCVYEDESGQLLTGSFMDYCMPRADDMPFVEFANLEVPNPNNPLGVKGCGEAGTIGAKPAVANAVLDALASRGIENAQMPFTPQKVWQLLNDPQAVAAE
jgi:carbon-monoxide dehydrogenase large subunit